LEKPE
jgi:hypothetical protein